MTELNLLGQTRCAICDGYGHTQKDCESAGKIDNLGGQGLYAAMILKQAKIGMGV